MNRHDHHFKNLFSDFLHEFMLLFFPDWDLYLDCSSVVWLKNEQFNKQPTNSAMIPLFWNFIGPSSHLCDRIFKQITLVFAEVFTRENAHG